jgi:ubiquinone/menaquinone biosynthesis C-methylase UbiE
MRDGKWTTEEFFATGVSEIETVIDLLRSLNLQIDREGQALDFGCGVGRLTQALSTEFRECYGIDISPEMIAAATRMANGNSKCHFLVNSKPDLCSIEDSTLSFIYCSIVLQHIEPERVSSYLREFVRVLRPGGILVFQVPERRKGQWVMRVRGKLKLRTRVRQLLTLVGAPEMPARSGWRMYCFSERRIRKLLERGPAQIVDVCMTNSCFADFNGRLQYFRQEPKEGFVSKQYVVVKA